MMILVLNIEKYDGSCGLDSFGSVHESVSGFCEDCDVTSGYTKCWEFLIPV
jgi:hypothetical protein